MSFIYHYLHYFSFNIQTSGENQLSVDTATVHVKDIFSVYLEYYWGIDD